ncbi:MAG: winged helix-turn-helix domain-containing protein [Enterococcus sp.]
MQIEFVSMNGPATQSFINELKRTWPEQVTIQVTELTNLTVGMEVVVHVSNNGTQQSMRIACVSHFHESLNKEFDFFLPWPIRPQQLVMKLGRIYALLSCREVPPNTKFFLKNELIYMNNKELLLTDSEFRLLKQFITHPLRVYSRDELLVLIGNDRGMHRVIDTHIKNLRKKIEYVPTEPLHIQTVHGRGYRFII